MSVGGKLVAGFFQGVQPRTAGFNSINTGALNPETLLGTDVLMFIGGGSAGTAGGIKVTTFAVLLYVIITEIRGDQSVTAFGRRLPREAQRQALTVALLAVAVVVGSTGLLLLDTDSPWTRSCSRSSRRSRRSGCPRASPLRSAPRGSCS